MEVKKREFIKKDESIKAAESESARKKTNRFAVISVVLCSMFLFAFFAGFFVRSCTYPNADLKAKEIANIIKDSSIYFEDFTADDLAEGIRLKMLEQDKYARYYTPEEFRIMQAEDAGNYSGTGIAISAGGIIAKVYGNSPADKAGVLKGDVLHGGVLKGETELKTFEEILEEKRAEDASFTLSVVIAEFFTSFQKGEELSLSLLRGETEYRVTLKKEDYIVSYVDYADHDIGIRFTTEEDGFKSRRRGEYKMKELPEDTAYIKLHAFDGGAAEQFAEAMDFMEERGKTKLILDLRDNGGGSVNILVDIASHLINDNGASSIKVLDAQGKNSKTHFSTPANNFHKNLRAISVIANYSTASAAECLMGAVLDYGPSYYGGAQCSDKNVVLTEFVEERNCYCTYGKGIMQTTYELQSGGAFTLTTAEISWPKTFICIQGTGITTPERKNRVSDEEAVSRAVEILAQYKAQ